MRKRLLVAALVALSAVLGAGAVSAAGDSTVTDVEIVNKTVAVTDDTEAIRVTGENITNGTASVEVYSINETGAESSVATGTLDTSATDVSVDTFEYSSLNTTKFDEYRVVVMGDNASDSVTVERVEVVAAGGGLFGGGSGNTALLAGAGLVLLVGAYVMRS